MRSSFRYPSQIQPQTFQIQGQFTGSPTHNSRERPPLIQSQLTGAQAQQRIYNKMACLPRSNPGHLQSMSYGSTTEMNASGPCYVKADLSDSGLPPYENTINMPDVKDRDIWIRKVYERNQQSQALDQPAFPMGR